MTLGECSMYWKCGNRGEWQESHGRSWKEQNESVLREIGVERELLRTLKNRKNKWLGHIMRGNSLYRTVIKGKLEGRRGREEEELHYWPIWGEEDCTENWKGWQKTEKDGGCQTCRMTCQYKGRTGGVGAEHQEVITLFGIYQRRNKSSLESQKGVHNNQRCCLENKKGTSTVWRKSRAFNSTRPSGLQHNIDNALSGSQQAKWW